MKKISFLLVFLMVFRGVSQETSINTTAMPFLLINSDARSGGMGDVGVATSSDGFSIFHNPSKIAFHQTEKSFGLNYTPWMRRLTNDIFVGGGSFINRFDTNAAWGIDVKYFALGQVDLRTGSNVANGQEKPNEFSLTGVYALQLSETFSMGVGLKYLNSNYKIRSANTNLDAVNSFAVDISGYYQSDEANYGRFNGVYRLGFNIANIGPKVFYTPGVDNFIPTNAKIGGGFDFIFDDVNSLGVTLEFTKLLVPSDQRSKKGWFEGMFISLADRSFKEELQETSWAIGAEYLYGTNFALRGGYFHESEQKRESSIFHVRCRL